MTLEEIRVSDKTMLTPADIAPVLGADPQDIRVAAKLHPERLGFNVAVIGTRVKVPRRAFIKWMEGERWEQEQNSPLGTEMGSCTGCSRPTGPGNAS